MADKDILTPGVQDECTQPIVENETPTYLEKDNYLGEFESEVEKELVRTNLGVPSLEDTFNKTETSNEAKRIIQEALQQHLNAEDPHSILPQVDDKLNGTVKNDGSTPFILPQTGVDPITEYHLTTKRFVENLLKSHLDSSDPHNIMSLVEEALGEYVKASQVYFKKEVYNREEVNSLLDPFVKMDGTTPFKRPQLGVDPKSSGHLTTKRYVDNLISEHLYDVDPHGFISTLNDRLSKYYRKTETYSKAETYSRKQLDSIISGLVRDAAKAVLDEHIYASDPHGTLDSVRKEHYVKRDGSVPFTQPQSGVDAAKDEDLVTLRQLKSYIESLELSGQCGGWITSGPVQTTVGFVEDNTQLPEHLTCQEIFDLIFYGKEIEVKSPEYWAGEEGCPVEMYIHGAVVDALSIELYQNDELIGTYTYDQFVDGKYTETSLPLTSEVTTFKLKVCYLNGTCLEATSTTKIGYFSYLGLLPKWYSGSNINLEYLNELIASDPVNNIQFLFSEDTVSHRYKFNSPEDPKHIFIMVPKSDNKVLYQMSTPSQQFGTDAFDIIADLPIVYSNGVTKVFTVYIYREVLFGLNNVEITFKFDDAT